MPFTRDNLRVAMPDLGWRMGLISLPSSQFWHEPWGTDALDAVSVVFSFNRDGTLSPTSSLYRMSVMPNREQAQVVQKIEEYPALVSVALPSPRDVRRLMNRLRLEGVGMLLLNSPST